MSQRVKRPNRFDDGTVPVKRRKRPTAQEEEDASTLGWRPINDLKIYNRATTEAPAELFRKDLISAMKLPDSEPLASNEYWVIVDQWKQEWERGVQVPVNPDSLPEPSVTVTHCATVHVKPLQEFKPPKTRYIRITKDDRFKSEEHYLSTAPAQAEAACSYDLDECDVAWLKLVNNERLAIGLSPITDDQLERVIERYELRCWDKIQAILRNEEGLGIEYDENVICDVCRSPDSEEGNEMVFCDSCNICVHQACYGITRIPAGQWLCCTCTIKQRPDCVLCPNKGGAMKSTRSGQKWAHVSCALWIPEVSIGCVEKMEPITKISSIPQSRWALICVLCRERVGACIQCSVKTCKTAYHVTCAFKHGLEMRAIIEDENADDGVKLRSYCEKHSKSSKKESKSICSGSDEDDCKRKKRKDMTSEEKNQARAARQAEIEAEFSKHVSVKDIAVHIEIDSEALQCIYNYWKLKRKAGHNRPLLPPKCEDIDMLSHKQEQADLEKMKMFVQLRQDLERVRNLCYMVSRREKLSRSYFKMRESTFQKQVAVLKCANLSPKVTDAVVAANRGPSIYDRLYSNQDTDETINLESLIARITGCKSPLQDSSDEKKPEINGLFKDVKNNPYKKLYFNGSSKRRSASLYGSSMSSSEDSSEDKPKPKHNKENRLHSSTDDEKPAVKKRTPIKNNKSELRKRYSITHNNLDSSSEDDIKHVKKEPGSNSGLKQIEKELGYSATDSDELMPIKTASPRSSPYKKAMSSIYSDSDTSDSSAKNDAASASDTQSQSKLRTKAAVKEFSHKPSTNKSPNKSSPENKKKTKEDVVKKDSQKKKEKDYVPSSDLIVPQRQAAKKATENLKSTTTARTNNKEFQSNSESDVKAEEKEKPTAPPTSTKPKKLGRPPKEPKDEPKEHKKKENATKEVKKEKKEEKEPKEKEKEKDKEDIFDIDKELDKTEQDILAYVPQRQAAKKAAEHIKGLGNKPGPAVETDEKKSKDIAEEKPSKKEKKEADKPQPAKVSSEKRKSSSNNSSTSSSSSSSSDSSTSSSSDSEDDRPKKQPQSESLSSPKEQTRRTGTKDWPFLDKAAKSAASSSSSDSSDSSRPPSPAPSAQRSTSKSPRRTPNKPGRKRSADKKSSTPPEREEPAARARGKGRPRGRPRAAHAGDRLGDAHVRSGDISDRSNSEREQRSAKTSRKGKSIDVDEQSSPPKSTKDKEAVAAPTITDSPKKLFSPLRETEKKVKEAKSPERITHNKQAESEIGDLEKEILERKAASNKTAKSKFDRLFGAQEVKMNKALEKASKSPVKENKEPSSASGKPSPTKKSPSKAVKSLDDIFANKLSNSINAKSPEHNVKAEHNAPLSKHEDILDSHNNMFKLEDEKPNNATIQSRMTTSIYQNTHSNDGLLDDIDDILEDGFGMSSKDEEMIKLPLTFNIASSMVFKEDSKEDSARETLNLVEKLRGNMGLNKKSTSYDVDDAISVSSSKHEDRMELDQSVPSTIVETSQSKEDIKAEDKEPSSQINLEMYVAVTKYDNEKVYNKFVNEPQIEDKSVPDMQHQHTDATAPADERWVPPSDSYPNLQAADSKPFNDVQPYNQTTYDRNSASIATSGSVQDDVMNKIQSPMVDRRVTRTPFLDAASSMDCMPSPVPYNDIHPQGKWSESNLMPNRRSSSSSVASSTSNISRRNNEEDEMIKRHEMPMFNHPGMDVVPPLLPQTMQYPPNSLDAFPQFSDANQFVGNPVSLFPPTNTNTQLPFPSPGAAMFPPPFGASFPTPMSVIPPMTKPNEETMHIPQTAAFTSSQHNMALTAAMVNMPSAFTPKPLINEEEDKIEEVSPVVATEPIVEPEPVAVPAASPALSNSTPNHVQPSPNPSVKSNSSSGKKSPSKPTRTSARFISQQAKSPSKSPGKSPRQELSKSASAGRNKDKKVGKGSSGRGAQSQNRGRGRGRGRGRQSNAITHDYDFNTNTIHNKLVGTVYDLDFDDDMSNECGDLRAMRERRKSSDVHERKAESPKFTSPTHKNRYHLSELRPPTPINSDTQSKPASPEPPAEIEKTFPIIVPPVLPGPVDMRTYNSTVETPQYNEANLLQQFAPGATEPQTHEELDDYILKVLQNELTVKPEEPHVPELNKIKVSLSDSRNQLKVKIKGPIANYTSSYSSTIAPLPTVSDTTSTNSLQTNAIANNAINNTPVSINSGATNLHRMRKKELLRQYCSQGMYTNDPASAPGISTTPVTPSLNRTIITIPKAVASMTSIPTKDDYRDYRTGVDDIFEAKIRKDKPPRTGLSRELRQLDLPLEDENSMERRRSIGSNNGNSIVENKRRGRPPRTQSGLQQTTPKLKIKLGTNNIISGMNADAIVLPMNIAKLDDKRDRIRPPKKRLSASVAKPSVEDLKRESMKFRKQVMADFSEKKEKKKKDKSNRKSKKKKKQDLQIVANDTNAATTKLIIRFKKNEKDEPPAPQPPPPSSSSSAERTDKCDKPTDVNIASASGERTENSDIVNATTLTTTDALNERTSNCASSSSSSNCNKIVSPIKLKLARCQKGYVMKAHPSDEDKQQQQHQHQLTPPPPPAASSATLNLHEPPPPVHTATPLPLNKDCEVR